MLFMGVDFSTQQIKAVLVDENGFVTHSDFEPISVPYVCTSSHPHLKGDNTGSIVFTNPIVWLETFDTLLMRMTKSGVPFHQVAAVSGAGQQHGSVYWNAEAAERLKNLDPGVTLAEQLQGAFASYKSPIWIDSSTTEYCLRMTDAVGGTKTMYELTGSLLYERFTGPQIMKKAVEDPEEFNLTEAISLVSSFAATLFRGKLAPIDLSDGSGMGLMNVRERQWIQDLCKFISSSLQSKLSPLAKDGLEILGPVSPYMQQRYGFPPECQVVLFTGDNPASVAGLQLTETDICLSLGSSDTILARQPVLPPPEASMEAVPIGLVDSVDSAHFFILIFCFKNGSLMRERVCHEVCHGSWSEFSRILHQTPKGNLGYLGFFLDLPEITPRNRQGRHFFNAQNETIQEFPSPEITARALLEGQALSRKYYTERLGVTFNASSRLILTGGASVNPDIAQVFADVFNCPTFVADVPNSAAYGAALRAKLASTGKAFHTPLADSYRLAATPKDNAVYQEMLMRYEFLEKKLL